MVDERGEIEKRLSQGLCPWCMQLLKETTYPNTRQCVACRGTVTDVDNIGEQHGDDTRSKS